MKIYEAEKTIAKHQWRRQGQSRGAKWRYNLMMSRTGNGKKAFFVLILATAEQLFNLYRSNFNLLLPDVPLMAHTVLLFKLIKEIRQWRIEDLARGAQPTSSPGAVG